MKFKHCEAVIFTSDYGDNYCIKDGQIVYFLGNIPNVPGHCIVAKSDGKVVTMVHTDEIRKAKDSEL